MTSATRTPDQQLAVDLATDAGRLLVELRSSGPTGRTLGDIGDRRANELLLERLADARLTPRFAPLPAEPGVAVAAASPAAHLVMSPASRQTIMSSG